MTDFAHRRLRGKHEADGWTTWRPCEKKKAVVQQPPLPLKKSPRLAEKQRSPAVEAAMPKRRVAKPKPARAARKATPTKAARPKTTARFIHREAREARAEEEDGEEEAEAEMDGAYDPWMARGHAAVGGHVGSGVGRHPRVQ